MLPLVSEAREVRMEADVDRAPFPGVTVVGREMVGVFVGHHSASVVIRTSEKLDHTRAGEELMSEPAVVPDVYVAEAQRREDFDMREGMEATLTLPSFAVNI